MTGRRDMALRDTLPLLPSLMAISCGVALSLGCMTGCADPAEPDAEPDMGAAESDILGGRADARTAPAVGSLVRIFPMANGEGYESFCTATLIAPKVVLTAKHCTLQANGKWGFATGAYATTDIVTGRGPDRFVAAERAEEESTITGGDGLGLGSDVALVHLEHAITDIKPLAIDALVDQDVGKTFTAIGYGVREGGSSGQRRSATVLLEARKGKVLPPLVSFIDYDRASGGDSAANRSAYDHIALLDGYEAVTGPDATGARLCSGDSGGPLLATRARKLRVVGVASYVLGTPTDPCVFGTVYATFGPAARAMIDRALR